MNTVHDEQQYLDLIQEIMDRGDTRSDRTGTGTLSVFGRQMRFCLRDNKIPLFTTKRVYWRGVVEELLWMIRGSTDSNQLAERKVHIWDANGTREFLDNQGFHNREQGDLGPVYGYQWRHWGRPYNGPVDAEERGGTDQLQQCVDLLRNNPTSRRIVMSSWNVGDIPYMALPPCHVLCQFYVSSKRELSCQLYQRSCDMGLGVPFNVASYSLLTHMMAQVCDLRPVELVYTMGDAHVYLNHVEALTEQCTRVPNPPPYILLNEKVHEMDEWRSEYINLVDYNSHSKISMPMSV